VGLPVLGVVAALGIYGVPRDFDAASGWECTGFSVTMPMYYQVGYRQGAGYRGPRRGGVDPGLDGFEASATGDLDGDGETSLFVITGEVVDQEVRAAPQVYAVDELE